MDRRELDEALRTAGVPESEYLIVGVPRRPGPMQDSYHVLREEDGGWLIAVWERGSEVVIRRFDTEAGACRYLYDRLSRRAPEPPPDSAAIMAELAEHREEIQRRAWDQYHRARRGNA